MRYHEKILKHITTHELEAAVDSMNGHLNSIIHLCKKYYAARNGVYSTIVNWEQDTEENLCGSMEIPMAVGLVGGAAKIHPAAQAAVKILGVKSAAELGEVIVCAGLCSSLASLKALATEGIQRGHMSLHARNIATVAGARGELLERIAKQMVEEKKVRLEYAKELVEKYS
ncbi:MAG: hypothetical protein LBP32_00605 [Spirochaetaceae bacterium]|jgi:hydroxymethylglutaryl-CoA reductase|nr:hypothetical protein [Spirochaetaceae bacterium]